MSRPKSVKSTPLLAVDTGGTFTDLLLLHEGTLRALKVPSTPSDPAASVLQGIQSIFGGGPPPRFRMILGSTVATNTLLERDGARVSLVTNAGFEDIIEIGRQNRPQLYGLTGERPAPLVDRSDRIGIRGRLGSEGEELTPVDHDELVELNHRLRGADTIAVVLLHSYANPSHELAVEAALEDLGIPLSLSSHILPEFREFERTSTTVANAYVSPRVGAFMARLSAGCREASIRVMGSNGGALSLPRCLQEPIHTVLSGPAGGVVGARDWAKRAGIERILSFDMGGTSTDVSLVSDALGHTRDGTVGAVPIAIPLLDIHTVGAGGGSIAVLDPGGALRVGPRSAGAEPGPICYGGGGTEVTVTDAHAWMGRLPDGALLGGDAPFDRDRVGPYLEALAAQAGLTVDSLAAGIVEVANAAMERALRVISVERGIDPSDHHLVAFGGAGALHAAELSDRLSLRGVLVPPNPGLLSAYGMLVAPIVRDRSRTVLLSSDDGSAQREVSAILRELEEAASQEMIEDGVGLASLRTKRRVDARYRGQSFELSVEATDWVDAFHQAHERQYGYRRNTAVEAVTLRVRVEAPGETIPISKTPIAAISSKRPARLSSVLVEGKRRDVPVLKRSELPLEEVLKGPAVIAEYSTTTWCPQGWQLRRDTWDLLHLSRDLSVSDASG